VAASLVGDANVQWNPPPSMGAEDFAYMLQQRPGAYIWIGNGDLSESRALHNPYYDFNDAILALGASYWVKLVRTILY
jgi:hippurate hydrolase